ncbi:MAG: D-alanine--D-alanine ligase [Actinomycetota bacterium]|nr:D-alanine--D-alanine ligase [Actinomycetota bacterium]
MLRIAVLMGGLSGEREVSMSSGNAVADALVELGYDVLRVDIDQDVLGKMAEIKDNVDAAFITLHGRLGEDGTIQGFLEMIGMPYTGSGVMASSMAMNKIMSKQIFRANAIPVADDTVVTSSEVDVIGMRRVAEGVSLDLGFPCIVKPNCEGSTLGADKARNLGELEEAIERALAYDELLIVERFIEGREMTVGLLGDEPMVLPVLEVVASKGVYDYECKYTKGMTDYIVPAPISDELGRELRRLALKAHAALECEGFSRVDFMMDADARIFCLEVNTIPGMTELSLIPKAATAAGLSFPEVVEIILQTARLKVCRGKECHEDETGKEA